MSRLTERSVEGKHVILLVESEVLVRHALADYLRDCGYKVLEAAGTHEAMRVLTEKEVSVDAVLCGVDGKGLRSGFKFQHWVRGNCGEVKFILAATLASAASRAAELCEAGPRLTRPYDPQAVVKHIKRLLSTRD